MDQFHLDNLLIFFPRHVMSLNCLLSLSQYSVSYTILFLPKACSDAQSTGTGKKESTPCENDSLDRWLQPFRIPYNTRFVFLHVMDFPQSRCFQRLEMSYYLFSLVLIWLLVVYLLFFTGKRDYYRIFYCNCLFYCVFTIPFASRPLGWARKLRASIIRERLKGMDFLTRI